MAKGVVLVIANPVSGGGKASEVLDGIRDELDAVKALAAATGSVDPSGWPILETTKDGSWLKKVGERLSFGDVRAVLAVGGDGTLSEVAGFLKKLTGAPPVIFAPGGRGNDFIRGFCGYSIDQGGFWDWMAREKKAWDLGDLDLGSADGRLFLNMASVGYGGDVVKNAQERNAFWSKTPLVYQVEGAIAFFGAAIHGREVLCEVVVDGARKHSGLFFGAFVGNGKANGSGLYWTKDASLNDGCLDLILFPRPSLARMSSSLNAVKRSASPSFEHARFLGREIVLHFDAPVSLELDGDFRGESTKHGFICLPRALKVWSPQSSD